MTINSVSGSNHYPQTQNLEATRPAPPPVKEQTPDPSTVTAEQRAADLSTQAFQVSITDQAREALRAEQAEQEQPEQPPASESPPPSNQAPRQDRGTTRIVDLVA